MHQRGEATKDEDSRGRDMRGWSWTVEQGTWICHVLIQYGLPHWQPFLSVLILPPSPKQKRRKMMVGERWMLRQCYGVDNKKVIHF